MKENSYVKVLEFIKIVPVADNLVSDRAVDVFIYVHTFFFARWNWSPAFSTRSNTALTEYNDTSRALGRKSLDSRACYIFD